MLYWKLFVAFFRIGIFGYGGGPSMIPLFHAECVKKYQWLTAEEFSDALALGNALPGPIATKMASYIGYRVNGWKGALVANLALILPAVVIMIGLMGVMYGFKNHPFIKRMIAAIQPVIGVMLAVLAYEFISKGVKEANNKGLSIGMLAFSLICISILNVPPGILVAVVLAVAFAYSTWHAGRQKRREKGVETK
ncbi:chromate transporter [Fodinisporobacter ferrooxydans]|uniref:Chromate transporter n=1 Tax=Fodinisporobacter ferrooxydans TaxID=2901836 RepID=A0ABY4CTP0_9BACL|nr:chromate transporter [Alicyclobacillaceae bacterium MYW30-H2]